jgi:hypothetical protein
MSDDGVTVGPLQVAALLLERAVAEATTVSPASRHSDGGGVPAPEHAGVAAQAKQHQRKTSRPQAKKKRRGDAEA